MNLIKITFQDAASGARTVEVEPNGTVMEAAVLNNVAGIVAECGGGCSCATCHVHVDEQWIDRLPAPAPEEGDLVEFLDGAGPTSRLSCQLELTPQLDGLVVRTPHAQG
ncbi:MULTISPECIES: 2Fe-2S iron-sulfur cluster-binding protein [Pseudonocardia]|uniref:Ferredoxin-6 n=2 Tax=Pseudonocardia TaxID=1847 RepID=A0A1Y2N0P9_PSEAH|nr:MULTISPECIES: 2Fe-2S iron-sulfur cluster-binding protein [Pseudonocardia]OSY40749.1 Ferredoxin-6 [Pseudonocardia autotrophica]TDN71944.1 2Fe-2S ferredoxin [Pseudonocardia autotrophica]BBG02631.1 (2Fe-2S) ferredoxin [Pseudonocardia autotrophica]GEC24690.1 (2Fe-2S) ferredoxin [Pseudonocardia saturnea]